MTISRDGAVYWKSTGKINSNSNRINKERDLRILSDQRSPMFAELFPERNAIIQGDNAAIHRAEDVNE